MSNILPPADSFLSVCLQYVWDLTLKVVAPSAYTQTRVVHSLIGLEQKKDKTNTGKRDHSLLPKFRQWSLI
jgi:hypothetical protein